nr:hypothetical protein [Tanacetum cinerariifolium]
MTTLAEHMIVAGSKTHPPMLDKPMYDSWESRMQLYIKGKKNSRMMLDSIDNGLLVYLTIEKMGRHNLKIYSKLTEKQQLQDDLKDTNNKRKWEDDHKGSSSQQQNKEPKTIRAHTIRSSNKKGYAGKLPLCNKCMFHHTGLCAAKCGNYKRLGHQTKNCRIPVLRAKQSPSVAKQKAKVTCYECGILGHFKSDCPKCKFQKRVNKYQKEKALRGSSLIANNVNA